MIRQIEKIEEKLNKDPKDAPALKKLGKLSLKKGDYKKAKENFRLAVMFSPRLLTDIILDYEKLFESDPLNVKARLSFADFYLAIRDKESAIIELEEILDIQPDFSQVYNMLGHILLEKQDVEGAIKLLEKAKDEGIKDIPLTEMLAGAYLEKGKTEKAVEIYKEILEIDPKSKKTLRTLAELAGKMSKLKDACDYYVKLFLIDQESATEVEKKLEELLTVDSENLYIREQLAEIYIKNYKPDLAVKVLKEIEELDKTKRDEVIGKYKKMLQIFFNQPSVLSALAASFVERGSYSDAAEVYHKLEALEGQYLSEAVAGYKKILSLFKDQMLAHSYLGDVFLRQGKIKEAIEEFKLTFKLDKEEAESVTKKLKEIIKTNPEEVLAHELLGEIYLQGGDAKAALQEAEECISLTRERPDSYLLLGESYEKIGLSSKSVDAYSSALNLDRYNITIQQRYQKAKLAELDREIESLKKRITEDQWRLSLHLDLAKLAYTKGDVHLAIEELQIAHKDQSRASFTYNLLGLCFKEQGRFDLATVQFNEALNCLPPELFDLKKTIGFNLAGVLEAQGFTAEAASHYQSVLQQDINFGKISQKIELLNSINPASLRNKSLIGLIKRLNEKDIICFWGRDGRGVSHKTGKEMLDISFGQDHNRAGFEYFMQGMQKSAKEEFILATSLDSQLSSALNNLGLIYLLEGNLDEAESKLSQAIDSDPNFAPLYNNLGLIKYAAGNLKEAEAKFKKAISLDERLSHVYINLGDVLYLQGNVKQAISNWERVREHDVVSEFAARRLLYRTLPR